MNIIYLRILMKMRPYRNEKVNIIRIISESIYTLASILLLLLPFLEKEIYLFIYKILGWLIVILFLVVTCLEMISLILLKK